jgi:hypothetical protein
MKTSKVIHFAAFLFLLFLATLYLGCPGKNSPTSPNNPPAATDTPTVTPTPTLCMNSSGTPCTSTFTPTASPTATPTSTATPTPSSTPTATCPGGSYSISGAVSFIGTPNAGATLVVECLTTLQPSVCPLQLAIVPGTNGPYTFTGLGAYPYYLVGLYAFPETYGIRPGAYVSGYTNGASFQCPGASKSALVPVAPSSGNPNPSGIDITFGTAVQLWGVIANVTYSGAQTNPVFVGLFTDGTYGTQITEDNFCCPPSTTNAIKSVFDPNQFCASETVYVMVWDGTNIFGPQSGDAYLRWGSTSTIADGSTILNITFDDTHKLP